MKRGRFVGFHSPQRRVEEGWEKYSFFPQNSTVFFSELEMANEKDESLWALEIISIPVAQPPVLLGFDQSPRPPLMARGSALVFFRRSRLSVLMQITGTHGAAAKT